MNIMNLNILLHEFKNNSNYEIPKVSMA
jgi:hypothetical protein